MLLKQQIHFQKHLLLQKGVNVDVDEFPIADVSPFKPSNPERI